MFSIAKAYRDMRRWLAPRGGLKRGQRALTSGRSLEASREWKTAAAAGNAESAFRLGQMFLKGVGVQAMNVEAKYWLERAAQLGHVEATYLVGRMLLRGAADGGALRWIKASQGRMAETAREANVKALFPHGYIYEADPFAAARFLEIAADLGHVEASALLSQLSIEGRGCETFNYP